MTIESVLARSAVQFNRTLKWKEGEEIFATGKIFPGEDKTLLVLLSGVVKIVSPNLWPGGNFILAICHHPGDILNGFLLTDEARAPWSAVAMEPCTIGEMPMSLWRAVISRPEGANEALAQAFRLIGELERRLDLGRRLLGQRIAGQLLELRDVFGETPDGFIDLRLTHKDLACMVGGSRENVTTVISKLEAIGLVERRRYKIGVKEPDGLRRVAVGEQAITNGNKLRR